MPAESLVPETHIHCEKLKARISQDECEWRSKQGGIQYFVCQNCLGEKKKLSKVFNKSNKKFKGYKILTNKICVVCGKAKNEKYRKSMCVSCYCKHRKNLKKQSLKMVTDEA